MAAGDITRSTPAALDSIANLNSLATGEAQPFGKITTNGEIALNIYLSIPIHASAVGGSYDLYLVESQDGTKWTDGIDPATAGNIQSRISDALFLKSISTIYNVTTRPEAKIHLPIQLLNRAKYIGFVLSNKSLQTIAATGSEGNYVTLKVSATV